MSNDITSKVEKEIILGICNQILVRLENISALTDEVFALQRELGKLQGGASDNVS
jgi:hypothetical protein